MTFWKALKTDLKDIGALLDDDQLAKVPKF